MLIALLLCLQSGCSPERSATEYCVVTQVDDATILPYRFEEYAVVNYLYGLDILPADFDGDGDFESVEIQSGRGDDGASTPLIFREEVMGGTAIGHVNVPAGEITSQLIADLDHDGRQEMLFTITRSDSIWIEIRTPRNDPQFVKMVSYGADRNGDGKWDGRGYICETGDLSGDGVDEILISVDVGYDLSGRAMICLDWIHDVVLWESPVSGNIFFTDVIVQSLSRGSDPVVIFGVDSKGNDYRTAGMDDQHAYIICLDSQGEPLLQATTGDLFAHTRPGLIDLNADGVLEIVTSYSDADGTGRDAGQIMGGLRVYGRSGELLQTVECGFGKRVDYMCPADYDTDGEDELVVSFKDHTLHIYDQQMNLLEAYQLGSRVEVVTCQDFVGDSEKELLVRSFDNHLTLYDGAFQPLAYFAHGGEVLVYPAHRGVSSRGIVLQEGHTIYHLGLVKTPWFTIFSRKPILAFLAAFLPLSLIIGVIWFTLLSIRRKNRIIAEQRDRLDVALDDLKTMQEELIAAEKFRQAKDIAGGFAHEIRNALYPAQLRLAKLSDARASDAESEYGTPSHLQQIERAVEKGIALTNIITSYCSLDERDAIGAAGIRQVMGDVVAANQSRIDEVGAQVSIGGEEEIYVAMDGEYLYIVLNNLLLNSLDSLTADAHNGRIDIDYKALGGLAVLDFTDNGCGIALCDIDRVFDTFYSTKPDRGTGIGLAMVKKTVEMCDGKILVSSSQGRGTRFHIELGQALPSSP